jgi:hypothetical protein
VGTFYLVRGVGRSAHASRFQEHIKDYLAITGEQPEQGEYLRGKVIVINARDKEVDSDVFFELPSALQAPTPEEVGTIVVLKWSSTMVGMYVSDRGNEGVASVQTCEALVIDKSIPAIVGRRRFEGGSPPLYYTGGSRDGPKPIQAVVDYITSLPRERGEEGPAPQGWTVLFRSDDPSVWNTQSSGDKFAIPVRQAHSSIRFLRLKRMDTGESIILPITRKDLARDNRPNPVEGCWWNGTNHNEWGGRHLGVAQVPPAAANQKGAITIAGHNFDWWTGSGFGHRWGMDDKQGHCWQGKEVPKTVFEIAVTASPLTEEEKRSLMTAVPDEGPAPAGWTVLFRSDDPTDWNTSRSGEPFAMPVTRAHGNVRFLRLKRMDTGEFLIVPISRKQLLRDERPGPGAVAWWNGTTRLARKARHLGIVQGPPVRGGHRGAIGLLNDNGAHFLGSGFGWKVNAKDGQHYCWQGKEVPKTVFEIAVTADALTGEEQAAMAGPVTPPPEELPPSEEGTPVPNAIAQPAPPPDVPGKVTVDLIPLIDPRKDTVHGRWVVVKNVLHCNSMDNVPRIQVPYQPPAEYDFVVTFSQPQLRNGINLIMPNRHGGSFYLGAAGHAGWAFGLPNKESDSFPRPMQANKAYTVIVQVRRGKVTALLDGKVVLEHKTDFSELTADDYRDIPDKKRLAVGCDDPTVFHYVRVVEVSGRGKRMR